MHFDPHYRESDSSSRFTTGFSETDFSQYWKILGLPVLITAALAVFFLWLQPQMPTWKVATLEGAFFFIVTALAARRDLTPKRSAILGGLAGFLIGLVVAVMKVVKLNAVYLYFNLISEPAFTAVFGAASGWAFGMLMVHFLRVTWFARRLPKAELDATARVRR